MGHVLGKVYALLLNTDSGMMVWLTGLKEKDVVELATASYMRAACSSPVQDPPTAPAVSPAAQSQPLRNKFAVYLSCVRGATPLGVLAPYLLEGAVTSRRERASLARFRCSCHSLRVETDRHLPAAVRPPRHLRSCRFCCSSAAEDEHHMVFDCPVYAPLRFQYADLFLSFSTCHDLGCFLDQRPDRVAKFVHACFDLRGSFATHMGPAGPDNAFLCNL